MKSISLFENREVVHAHFTYMHSEKYRIQHLSLLSVIAKYAGQVASPCHAIRDKIWWSQKIGLGPEPMTMPRGPRGEAVDGHG